MKKRYALTAALLAAVLGMSACSSTPGSSSTDVSGAASTDSTEDAGSSGASDEMVKKADFLDDEAYISNYKLSDYVTLGTYKGIEVSLPKVEVTDEEVEAQFESFKASVPAVEVKDRKKVKEGDVLNINYSGKLAEDGTVFEGGTAENQTLEIGSGRFIPGFEEQLIGHEVGETFDIKVTFPDEYNNNKELEGKDTIFTVKVNSISEHPELTEDNVAELAETAFGNKDIKSIKDLKAYIKDTITSRKEDQNKTELEGKVLEAVVENSEFTKELPSRLVERYVYQLERNIEAQIYSYSMYGYKLTKEEFIENSMKQEGFEGTAEEYLKNVASEWVKQAFILYAIGEKEKLIPDKKEVEAEAGKQLASSGVGSIDDYEKNYGIRVLDSVEEGLVQSKVVSWLGEQADVKFE